MPPVVVSDVPVILFDGQQPSAQHAVGNLKGFDEVEFDEHAEARAQGVIVRHAEKGDFSFVVIRTTKAKGSFQNAPTELYEAEN